MSLVLPECLLRVVVVVELGQSLVVVGVVGVVDLIWSQGWRSYTDGDGTFGVR